MTGIIYNKGMAAPVVTGRPVKSARHWEATITLRYAHMTEVVEFKTKEKCRVVDLVPVIHAEIKPVFEVHGEPEHYAIKAKAV